MLWVLGQVAPQAEDLLHNPAFLVLLGVFATAFISVLIAVVGWLLKTVIDGIRDDIKEANAERHVVDEKRLKQLEGHGDILDKLQLAEAARAQREVADDRDRIARQAANEKRFALNEEAVVNLKAEIARDFGVIHGRLDAALGRQNKDGS